LFKRPQAGSKSALSDGWQYSVVRGNPAPLIVQCPCRKLGSAEKARAVRAPDCEAKELAPSHPVWRQRDFEPSDEDHDLRPRPDANQVIRSDGLDHRLDFPKNRHPAQTIEQNCCKIFSMNDFQLLN